MPAPIILPQWGMAMNDGLIVKWLKNVGDEIKKGDQLVEIESSKVNAEIEATHDGKLGRVDFQEGVIVDVGTVVGYILFDGETESELPNASTQVLETAQETSQETQPSSTIDKETSSLKISKKQIITPRARRLAKELDIKDFSKIIGSGPSGRVTEDDIRKFHSSPKKETVISTVPVKESIPLSSLRLTISKRMSESAQIPSVTLNTRVDITQTLEKQRNLVKEWRKHKIRPQFQDLVIAAVAKSLHDNPHANAHLVNDEIRVLDEVNIGIAMAVVGGLLVPVIKKADKKTILDIALEIRQLAKKSKENTFDVDDLSGSTFSVTNLSSYDITTFNPLLNPPEIGILGIGSTEEIISNNDEKKSFANFCLTFDHRAWDGAPASEFLKLICKNITNIDWMFN
ncbi:MAG: dihydrolipoamide acetyltransferase family protein [Dehalococcoidia bacterium]